MKEKIETTRCEMSGGIVSYMYQEMTTADRLAFEEHLLSCSACIDEFAEIADARLSVYEWRKVEFEAMPTPEILIPYKRAARVSWFGKLRAASSFAPVWGTVGLSSAAAAVVLAVGLVGYQLQNSGDVAANIGNAESAEFPKAESTVAANGHADVEMLEELITSKTHEAEVAAAPVVELKEPGRVDNSQPVRTGRRTVPVTKRTQAERDIEPRRQPVQLPTFTEFAEQEDETLRLAELFDDIETSE